MHKSSLIRLMEDAVRKAGRGLARDFGEVENLQVSRKGPGDFVTSADLRAEQTLIKELQKARPKFGFLTEESLEIPGEDEKHRWIIDPLDGTTNFMHGIPHFCTSLALEQVQPNGKKEIIAAVIHAPALEETYWAERGEGGYVNDRRLQASGRDKMENALVAAYLPKDVEGAAKQAEIVGELKVNTRVYGSAALELAYVAAGKLDAFWHGNLQPWDMAAGILLVREARGMVCDVKGDDTMIETGSILAANSGLHDDIRKTLSKYY